MPVLLSDIRNADDAKGLFSGRRPAGAIANTAFYDADHWQDNRGWIGAKPLIGVTGFSQTMAQIKEAFVSENVIAEVIERHVAGVLGREPLWGFVPQKTVSERALRRRRRFSRLFGFITESSQGGAKLDARAQEADEALTVWWDQGRPRQKLKEALIDTLNEDKVLLRFFVPQGLRDENGAVPIQQDLSEALDLLYLDVVKSDKGGVFIDDDTQKEFALYVYERDGEAFAELSYLKDSLTVLQLLEEETAGEPFTYDLGGRLWMYEMQRPALITEQVRSNQRSVNLALTMMMRNVNLAGSLERTVMNAERPKTTVQILDSTEPSGYREEKRDADYFTGAGATMFLTGLLVRDDEGRIIGRADPNISFREPVTVKTFQETRDQFYASILGQCQQRHALISGDAASSGKSREQARAEFRGSLMLTKESLDDAGRWMLETGLRLAAQFCDRTAEFADLRCDFGSLVEDGPLDSAERQENRADVQAGLMSKETAMSRNGAEDTDAEKVRIAEDRAAQPAPVIDLTAKPPNGGTQLPA
jgi:hypothetical protein